jgi:peptidoglycan/LPS O-acetylase OafA/YrhL
MNLQIQSLRGLACVLLVLYHVVGSDNIHGLRIDHGALRVINDGLAYLRMPLFTVLSGLVYGLRPFDGDSRRFLLGKVRRLLIPMLVVGTVFALIQSQVPGVNTGAPDWRTLHILPVGHFWYCESLLWVFLLIWLVERWHLLDDPAGFAAIFTLAVLVYLSWRGPRWLGIQGAIYLLPYFLGGLAVQRLGLWQRLRSPWLLGLLFLIALLAVVEIGWPVPNPNRRTVWILLAGLALCGLCLGLFLSLRIESTLLIRVGQSSYAIYLFHVFFTAAMRISLKVAHIDLLALQILAGLALGLAGPMLIDHWGSRQRWTRLLLLGKSATPKPPVPSRVPVAELK